MITRQATVKNAYGIHCRPSAIIVKEAQRSHAAIRVVSDDGREADAKNLLSVIALGLSQGAAVQIHVEGPDEEEVCRHMVELFETDFDFPR